MSKPLSPSGYIINDAPLEQNPFFSFEVSDDVSTEILSRVVVLENSVDLINSDIDDLKNADSLLEQQYNTLNNKVNTTNSDIELHKQSNIESFNDVNSKLEEIKLGLIELNSKL